MNSHLIDMKVSALCGFFLMVSFSKVEIAMKVIAFLITVGYTLRRWYLLEKNKRE